MLRLFLCCLATFFCTSALAVPLPADLSTQTPRQAVIEMFSGSEEKFRQHLTVEVQEKLRQLLNSAVASASSPLEHLPGKSAGQKFDAFESGPILFAVNDAEQHQRLEIRLEADDWKETEDTMELSLHSFRSGIEEEMPVRLHFQLGLKLQDSVWRLNTLTVSANLPVGDPRILDKSWWMPQMFAGPAPHDVARTSVEQTQISPMRAVHRIALAENLYAQRHPDVGFTCALPNLVNVGKGLDENGSYQFLDPEFAAGVYNGYRFALQGCAGKPVRAFQVMAEPVNGKGKAYCADEKRTVRSSSDGRGATCLATGSVARQ